MPSLGDLLWTTTPQVVFPADGSLVAVVTLGPATWTNSDWESVVPAQADTTYVSGLTIDCVTAGAAHCEVDLGVGVTDVSVTVKATLSIVFGVPQWIGLPVPLRVTTGDQLFVRVRMASGLAGIGWSFSATAYPAPFTGTIVSTTTALSRLPAQALITVTPAGAPWTSGAWATIIASASADLVLGLMTLYAQINVAFASLGQAEIDIGIGAAASEVVVTTLRWSFGDTAPAGFHVAPIWPLLDAIPSGSRVAARIRTSTGTGANATLGCALHFYAAPLSDNISTLTTGQRTTWLPANSLGTALTVPAGAWTASAWGSLGSTTAAAAIVGAVMDSSTTADETEIELGADAARDSLGTTRAAPGFVVNFGTANPLLMWRQGTTMDTAHALFARARSKAAGGGTIRTVLGVIQNPDFSQRSEELQRTYIAAANGPFLLTAGSPWVNSPWGELTPAAAGDMLVTGIAIGVAGGTTYVLADLGTGVAGAEAVIATVAGYIVNIGLNYLALAVPVYVTDGTRLAIRWRQAAAPSTRALSVTYLGASSSPTPPTVETVVQTIRRLRVVPHVSNNGHRIFFERLQIDMQPGIGTTEGQGETPLVTLRVSNDGGFTWGNARHATPGQLGNYLARVQWYQLGSARDRVFEFVVSDPNVGWTVVQAWIDATEGET